MRGKTVGHTGRRSGKPPAQSRRCRGQPPHRTWPGGKARGRSYRSTWAASEGWLWGSWALDSSCAFTAAMRPPSVVALPGRPGACEASCGTFQKGWSASSLSQKPAAPALVDATISAMPVVMPGCLWQRRHVSTVMVGYAVGNARGITSLMVIAYRPPRSPADPAPPLDAAVHGLAPGVQVAALVIGAGETGMQPGDGFNFLSR